MTPTENGAVAAPQPVAAPEPAPALAPVSAADRIQALDVVRGCALLGILLMNILTFGLPFAAYGNPTVAGGSTGLNLAAWVTQFIVFDGKMRALFSLCFGAGVILLTMRGEKRGAGIDTADVYYRRTLWLLLFGLLHAYFIWWGDILYPYALCALVLFPLRKLSPRTLLIAAGVLVSLLTLASLGQGRQMRETRDKALKAQAAEKAGQKLTKEQEDAKKNWEKALKEIQPPPEDVKKEIDDYRGGYLSALKRRAGLTFRWHSKPFYFPMMFDFYAMMLVGMAFMKMDVLSAGRSWRFFAWMAALGYLIGLPVNSLAAWQSVHANFEPLQVMASFVTYHFGRVAVALAHLAVILMVVKAGALAWLTRRLAAVGQMAFSNYLSHSLICTLIFYGYGLGMIGKLQRYQLYGVVLLIWVFNLAWSPLWLRRFQFGPMEWCWRSLTYWKRQPMRIRQPALAAAAAVPAEASADQGAGGFGGQLVE